MSDLHDKLIHLAVKYTTPSDEPMPGYQILELLRDVDTELHTLESRLMLLETKKPIPYLGPRG